MFSIDNKRSALMASIAFATLGLSVTFLRSDSQFHKYRQNKRDGDQECDNDKKAIEHCAIGSAGGQVATGLSLKCFATCAEEADMKGVPTASLWSTPRGVFLVSAIRELESSLVCIICHAFRTLWLVQLSGCGLTTLPAEIGDMIGLKKLNAAKNRLASLPPSFVNLKKLHTAFFLGCEFEVLPAELGSLPQLSMLSFKANRLHTVPSNSLAPSVQWLILSDNRLRTLPESLGHLRGLRKLMLAGNRLECLPKSLSNCVHLELVRLADNNLTALPMELLSLPKLGWIALASNGFNRALAARARALVPTAPGTVTVLDAEKPLGRGASGVVYRGSLKDNQRSAAVPKAVAVKVFAASKTSDGDPADEAAATGLAGASSCPHLMQSYGKLPSLPQALASTTDTAAAAASNPSAVTVADDKIKGLVLELLDGYTALAGPPSFASVTRDVFVGDGADVAPSSTGGDSRNSGSPCSVTGVVNDVSQASPDDDLWPGEALSPARVLTLKFAVGVLRSVSAALAELHALGLSHGDVYGHNILLRPPLATSRDGAGTKVAANDSSAAANEDGWAVLSDLGAAFFYKTTPQAQADSAQIGNSEGFEEGAASLLERVEVLAFGHLTAELLARLHPDQPTSAPHFTSAIASLQELVADCREPAVSARPNFTEVHRRIFAVGERGAQ